jgi:hypothetical protein
MQPCSQSWFQESCYPVMRDTACSRVCLSHLEQATPFPIAKGIRQMSAANLAAHQGGRRFAKTDHLKRAASREPGLLPRFNILSLASKEVRADEVRRKREREGEGGTKNGGDRKLDTGRGEDEAWGGMRENTVGGSRRQVVFDYSVTVRQEADGK